MLAIGKVVIKIGNMERPAFPRIGSVYRSFDSEHERIGVGFLDKSGISRDLIKYRAPSWSLVCVLYGSGRYVLDDGPSFELNAGDCFIRQAGRLHSNYIVASSQWFEAFVDFGPKLADSLT